MVSEAAAIQKVSLGTSRSREQSKDSTCNSVQNIRSCCICDATAESQVNSNPHLMAPEKIAI